MEEAEETGQAEAKLLPLMKPVKGERAGKAVRRRIRMIS